MRTLLAAAAAAALLSSAALAQNETQPNDQLGTDSATAGSAATMDGTMPVDASPAAADSNAAQADQANTGETGNPVPGAATTTTHDAAGGGHTMPMPPATN